MDLQFSRTQILLGDEAMKKLQNARVAVFGIGGVGGYTAEALARSGIGAIDLIDPDEVSVTNINRQLFATHSTVGRLKAEVAKERLLDIYPGLQVTVHPVFYTPETADQFDFTQYDYIVDAIDTVTGKLCLAERAFAAGTPIISCMGAGNKLDGTAFQVADISKTTICPLARVMRKELKKAGHQPHEGGFHHGRGLKARGCGGRSRRHRQTADPRLGELYPRHCGFAAGRRSY